MSRRHLLFAGALMAAGAMLPVTAGALAGAEASPAPTPATTFTAAPVGPAVPVDSLPDCDHLKLGDAWAGVSLHCGLDKPKPTAKPAPKPAPVPAPVRTATAPKPKPAPAQTAPKRCQEDDPCWDCRTMGSKSCGADPAMLGDAWASFDGSGFAKAVDVSRSFRVDYLGTSTASSIPGYWVVRSLGQPGTFHVFVIRLGA